MATMATTETSSKTSDLIFCFGSNLHSIIRGGQHDTTEQETNHHHSVAAKDVGNAIMRRYQTNHDTIFNNDYSLYERLCQEPGCQKVDIAAVCVRHNNYFCQGMQVTYRSTLLLKKNNKSNKNSKRKKNGGDGDDKNSSSAAVVVTKTTKGAPNFFARGIYARGRIYSTWLILQPDEYITGLTLYQGQVVDGIEFFTNRRVVHISGDGGAGIVGAGRLAVTDRCFFPPPATRRIVAFAGTAAGILQRLGYYAEAIKEGEQLTLSRDESRYYDYHHCQGNSQNTPLPPRPPLLQFTFSDCDGNLGSTTSCVFVSTNNTITNRHFSEPTLLPPHYNINHTISNHDLVFDDFLFYKSLCRRPGCKKVEISSVCIYFITESHHHGCQGFEVIYRLTFSDGSTCKKNGPRNFFKRSSHRERGGHAVYSKWLHLGVGEYIRGVVTISSSNSSNSSRGAVVRGMKIVTNHRVFEQFCDDINTATNSPAEGDEEDIDYHHHNNNIITMMVPRISMQVVAFAGIWHRYRNLKRVGYYAKPMAWDRIGHLIMLRWLWQSRRATPRLLPTHNYATGGGSDEKDDAVATTSTIVYRLFDLSDGIFNELLCFLF